MSRVPRIRFKGFEEDWEQRKLISCLSLLKDGTHGTHKDYPSGPLLLSAKNIKNGRVNYDETDRRISYKDFEKIHSNFKLQVGDVLLTIVGSIGETALLQNTFGITFQRSVAFLRVTDNIIPEFLMSEINTSRFKNELENRKSTSAQPGIYLENLGEIPVFISKNSDEQLKIGSYFDSLNHLITLHQSKSFWYILKSIVSCTLYWEQRKLGEVIQERNIRTSDFDKFPIFSLTIESGVTPKTERYERSSLVTKTEDLFKVVKPNEFVTNPMNLRFGALGYNTQKYDISVSGYYDVFSIDGNNCSGFWNAYFKTQQVMNIFDNVATGSLVEKKRVKYSTLKQIYVSVPSAIEEKNKISKFMSFTDHLITLHQLEPFQLIFKAIAYRIIDYAKSKPLSSIK